MGYTSAEDDLIDSLPDKLRLYMRKKSPKLLSDAVLNLEKLEKLDMYYDYSDTILDYIILPFAVEIIKLKDEIISQKMISSILCWIKKQPDEDQIKELIQVLAEKKAINYSFKWFDEKTFEQAGDYIKVDIDYIFALFDIKTLGKYCDDLISFILWLINEKVEGKNLQVVFNTNISEIWLLYFDPLCVESVDFINSNDVIGKQDVSDLTENIKLPVKVHWTDNRSDEVLNKNYRRKRIDELVHYLLDISVEKYGTELLKFIPHEKILKIIETCKNECLKSSRTGMVH